MATVDRSTSADCAVCNHPDYSDIDAWLRDGVTLELVATAYGLSPASVRHHVRGLCERR
jgi:hypothetical protein